MGIRKEEGADELMGDSKPNRKEFFVRKDRHLLRGGFDQVSFSGISPPVPRSWGWIVRWVEEHLCHLFSIFKLLVSFKKHTIFKIFHFPFKYGFYCKFIILGESIGAILATSSGIDARKKFRIFLSLLDFS